MNIVAIQQRPTAAFLIARNRRRRTTAFLDGIPIEPTRTPVQLAVGRGTDEKEQGCLCARHARSDQSTTRRSLFDEAFIEELLEAVQVERNLRGDCFRPHATYCSLERGLDPGFQTVRKPSLG